MRPSSTGASGRSKLTTPKTADTVLPSPCWWPLVVRGGVGGRVCLAGWWFGSVGPESRLVAAVWCWLPCGGGGCGFGCGVCRSSKTAQCVKSQCTCILAFERMVLLFCRVVCCLAWVVLILVPGKRDGFVMSACFGAGSLSSCCQPALLWGCRVHGELSMEWLDVLGLLFGPGLVSNGEFDPGSGRTLAARLTHASRGRSTFGCGDRRTGE